MNANPDIIKRVGGGLILEDLKGESILSASDNFTVPAWVDGRPYCISTSNQGSEPSCAGFATAGFKEIENWRTTHVSKQFDGDKCYDQAKQCDGSPDTDGTTLTSAIQGAKDLGWFDESKTVRTIYTKRELQYALHKHGSCIAGFNITKAWQNTNRVTGMIKSGDANSTGGHAVLVCYYDQTTIGWQNSWGAGWGVKGFGRMTWDQFDKQFQYAVVME